MRGWAEFTGGFWRGGLDGTDGRSVQVEVKRKSLDGGRLCGALGVERRGPKALNCASVLRSAASNKTCRKSPMDGR